MRTFPCPSCFVCGAAGVPLYDHLRDRLFSAPGTWSMRRCPTVGCGLLWLDPAPTEQDIGEAYHDYLTHGRDMRPRLSPTKRAYLRRIYGYGADAGDWWDAVRATLFRLRFRRREELDGQVFHLPKLAEAGRLLDVGCGSGEGMELMAQLGWRVEGVEVDPEAVKTARSKGLRVHAGSLAEQQFADDSFDAVTLSHVIEHVHRPIELMAECHRVLKPGGMLVMLTPNAAGLGHAAYRSHWVALEPPRHLHIFTPAALAAVTHKAGFDDIEVKTTIRGGEWMVLASQMIRRTGRGADQGKYLWIRRRWARLFQAFEWLMVKIDGRLGEEILVRARKHA